MSSGGRRHSELERQAARHLHTRRGAGHERPISASAWRCEGRWQADEQLDIWQCIDQVALDAMREHGEPDDEDTTDESTDEHEQV